MKGVRNFILAMALVLIPLWAFGELWDATPNFEAEPGDTDPLSEADDRMNEIKVEVRRRGEVGHWWGSGTAPTPPGDDDNGLHRIGSARIFMADTAPTALDQSIGDYDSIVGTEQAETDLDNSASNSGAAIGDDVGHGRLWADTNSAPLNALWVFQGVAGDGNGAFDEVSVAVGHGDDEILAGSYNLVYNGTFEATDGTGAAAATGTPAGFTVIDAATFTYGTGAGDEDKRWGDGLYAIVTDVDGTDGMQFVLTNLSMATTYRVIARVAEEAADDICTLATTGGLTNIAGEASAGIAWQTLSGTFTTAAAALDTVTVTFVSTAAGDICNWDNIGVYQVGDVTTDRDAVSMPSSIALYDSDTTTNVVPAWGAKAAVPNLSLEFTPPTPGWIIQVNALIVFGEEDSLLTSVVNCNFDNGADITGTQVNGSISHSAADSAQTIPLGYVAINPTPGTAITYTVECGEEFGGAGAPEYNPNGSYSSLWLTALAPR